MITLIIIIAIVFIMIYHMLAGLDYLAIRHDYLGHIWMRWKFTPEQTWYFTYLDILLMPIMEIAFRGKLTHGWHWVIPKDWHHTSLLFSERLDGDPCAPAVYGSLSQIRAECKFFKNSWKTVVILEPFNIYDRQREWHLHFSATGFCYTKCTLKLKGAVRAYIGSRDIYFLATDLKGNRIKLSVVDRTNINDKRYEKVPLI